MRHYVLTRSAYAPTAPMPLNLQRLALTEGIAARSMRSQTEKTATWLVLIDEEDPLLAQRKEAYLSSGLACIFAPAENLVRGGWNDRPRGPWSKHIDWSDAVLTSRLDDDDGMISWALARVREAAETSTIRTVWTYPAGYRVFGSMALYAREANWMFQSLYAPKGDRKTIMDERHLATTNLAPMRVVTDDPAWVWVRHDRARSDLSVSSQGQKDWGVKVNDYLRRQFDVDWDLCEHLNTHRGRGFLEEDERILGQHFDESGEAFVVTSYGRKILEHVDGTREVVMGPPMRTIPD